MRDAGPWRLLLLIFLTLLGWWFWFVIEDVPFSPSEEAEWAACWDTRNAGGKP